MQDPERLPGELVAQFVGACHGDLARAMELLAEEPALLNAAWDWGGGDWETGLGAAAHMGRRDIAMALLDRGARLDLFAAAMLDFVDVVSAILNAVPCAAEWRGPHGIPLLVHARVGEAAEVLKLIDAVPAPR